MQFILGAINGHYLRDITLKAVDGTEEVRAAVAYATENSLLFDWCWENEISLTFWGRLDETVAVKRSVLEKFLDRKSHRYVCKLVQHHHAKVIWWRGYGVYVGSANLTDSAWNKNVEAGCFFDESEIDDGMASDIENLFDKLDDNATPLTQELLNVMIDRSKEIAAKKSDPKPFWTSPSIKTWSGLVRTAPKKANDQKKQDFLEEWHATLQDLRNIGDQVSKSENRPKWVSADAPVGAQADQFLHAHYYQRTMDGNKARYRDFYERNRTKKEEAVNEAIKWWRELDSAPSNEDAMLNKNAPFLRNSLTKKNISTMTYRDFHAICSEVHAIRDYSRRVRNKSVSLPDDGTVYSIPQKIDALATRIWRAIVKSGVWAFSSSGGLIILGDFDTVFEFNSGNDFPEAVETA